jgi:hypothetical protein
MLLAGFVALVVILTVVVVNLSGLLKFIRFNVEFEGQKACPRGVESSNKREILLEPRNGGRFPDPTCGTGTFLIAALEFMLCRPQAA